MHLGLKSTFLKPILYVCTGHQQKSEGVECFFWQVRADPADPRHHLELQTTACPPVQNAATCFFCIRGLLVTVLVADTEGWGVEGLLCTQPRIPSLRRCVHIICLHCMLAMAATTKDLYWVAMHHPKLNQK